MPRPWAIAAALSASLVLAALLLREPIGRWLFPDAAVAGLLAEADEALARGDIAMAARRFQAAQARSPDHPRVAVGLAETRAQALAAVSSALARGALDDARSALGLAATLGAPGERLAILQRELEAHAEPSLEDLLGRAMATETADPEQALASYRQVLERAPDNALARAGRSRLLGQRLAVAADALARGELDHAEAIVAEVRAIDPAHLALPELEMRLGSRAAAPRPPGPVASPVVLDDALRWRGLAEEALGRGALAEARRALDRARHLDPAAPDLAALEARWARARADSPGVD